MSNWNALPDTALWYGEVIFEVGGQVDYNYAYSVDTCEPDPHSIPCPDGAEILEATVAATNTGVLDV